MALCLLPLIKRGRRLSLLTVFTHMTEAVYVLRLARSPFGIDSAGSFDLGRPIQQQHPNFPARLG